MPASPSVVSALVSFAWEVL